MSRDNFTAKTIANLAGRVGYRCSYPDCNRLTIGPKQLNDEAYTILGEAAHIHAASPQGPRPKPEMSKAERVSIQNGIWLCRTHARIIDADPDYYAAETLQQWKATTEAETYRKLMELEKDTVPIPTTLICLNENLMFEGIWKSAAKDFWRIVVKRFVFGNEEMLKDFTSQSNARPMHDYIIIASQGDGRLIKAGLEWTYESGELEIIVPVYERTARTDPNHTGTDLAFDGDLVFENGDLKTISGAALARQLIERNLGMPFGSWIVNPLLGSYFSMYYHRFKDQPELLNKLVKVEITRLATIPVYQNPLGGQRPELSFINRVNSVVVGKETNKIVPVHIALEWGNGTYLNDILHVRLYRNTDTDMGADIPAFVKELFEEKPFEKLKVLSDALKGEELKGTITTGEIMKHFAETLPQITELSRQRLEAEIYPRFHQHYISYVINGRSGQFLTPTDLELELLRGTPINEIGFTLFLKGYKKAGTQAFDITIDLFIFYDDYNYKIGASRQNTWATVLPGNELTSAELVNIAGKWTDLLASLINQQLQRLL